MHAVAQAHGLTPPAMEQPQYNLLHRGKVESEFLPLYENYGLGTTIWSPLASGILTGKYNDGVPSDSRLNLPDYEWLKELWSNEEGKQKIEKVRELTKLSKELGISMTHLSISWCLKNPNVSTVILGSSRLNQLEDNLKSLDVIDKLTPDVMVKIEAIIDNKPAGPERFGQ